MRTNVRTLLRQSFPNLLNDNSTYPYIMGIFGHILTSRDNFGRIIR